MKRIRLVTSSAANYLPKAQALFDSVRRFHPQWELHLALADEGPAELRAGTGPVEVHRLADLGIPSWRAWVFCHSLVELATAIKPFVMLKLLDRGDCDAVVYLDPDVLVFSELSEVLDALDRSDVLLTPHLTAPETDLQGVIANEICTLQHGVHNLGFIAIADRAQARAFLRWWRQRTYHFCRVDLASGLFTDQRWIDLAAALFPGVEALRSPRLNVGPWNLATRPLTGEAPHTLKVGGEPLGFFHFSGADRRDVFANGEPAADALVGWYRAIAPLAAAPWAFAAFSDGEPIQREQRLVFRLRGDLQAAFPDPFRSGKGSFQAWWAAQAPVEFPALFDAAARGAEITRLGSALTTGYPPLRED
jgi:hypothetical protein